MKTLYTFLVFIFLLTTSQEIIPQYNPTRLIVKFMESSNMYKSIRQILVLDYSDKIEIQEVIDKPEIISFFNTYKISSIKPAKPFTSASPLADEVERIYYIDFQNNDELEIAFLNLKALPEFEYVEYDERVSSGSTENSSNALYPETIIPNDPGFINQWGLRNTGQTIGGVTGIPGADINIAPAWDLTTGNENTIISVLDTGIPLTAPEFSGRILPGYDFANNDNDPTDDHGHGTHVTSIMAATGNNSFGIAGVNWSCNIIPIKILDNNGFGFYSWIISGIIMATDSGAKVLNMSVGGLSYSQGMKDAVDYALNLGSIIVAAMGNGNFEYDVWPARYNNVISVGALNNIDRRAVPFCWGGGSNFGNHIDFVAPGDWILGLDYPNPTQTTYKCGTSMSTPMVAGLISLMLGLDLSLNLQQIYDKLKFYAHDQIGDPSEDTPGWDKYYGWGRIDAYSVIQSIIPVELSSFTANVNNDGNVILNWNTATELNNQMFEIERKNIDGHYATIGYVDGYGTTTEPQEYTYVDNTVETGTFFYRLKQIDFGGHFEYSDEIEVEVIGPLTFALEQNYPNPFNPSTNIKYSVPENGFVKLSVYNLVGEEVIVLVNETVDAGFYEVTFNATALPSGVYFYRLQAGDFIETKNMVLMK